jgi:hypothetical protein
VAVLRMIFGEVGVPSSSLLYSETIGEEWVFYNYIFMGS